MVAFKINKEASAPGARSPRRRVVLDGIFQSMSRTDKVSVRNISRTGAAIAGPFPLKIGAEGVLQVGGIDCLCRVVHSDGQVHGLVFDRELPNQVVLDLHRVTQADIQREQAKATRAWFEQAAR